MPKPIDAELVKTTLQQFRGAWDWQQSPVLRLPLRRWSLFENRPSEEVTKPVTIEYAEYRRETGTVNGRPMERIVGSVPGTDISAVCEMHERHS